MALTYKELRELVRETQAVLGKRQKDHRWITIAFLNSMKQAEARVGHLKTVIRGTDEVEPQTEETQ